jgi:uncharacterized protein involved in cysteine biosynthesis
MLKQSDIEGRLRLFRYGLVVLVVVAFLLTLLLFLVIRQALINNLTPDLAGRVPGLEAYLGILVLVTVVVAVLAVVAYFIYHYILTKKLPFGLLDRSGENK